MATEETKRTSEVNISIEPARRQSTGRGSGIAEQTRKELAAAAAAADPALRAMADAEGACGTSAGRRPALVEESDAAVKAERALRLSRERRLDTAELERAELSVAAEATAGSASRAASAAHEIADATLGLIAAPGEESGPFGRDEKSAATVAADWFAFPLPTKGKQRFAKKQAAEERVSIVAQVAAMSSECGEDGLRERQGWEKDEDRGGRSSSASVEAEPAVDDNEATGANTEPLKKCGTKKPNTAAASKTSGTEATSTHTVRDIEDNRDGGQAVTLGRPRRNVPRLSYAETNSCTPIIRRRSVDGAGSRSGLQRLSFEDAFPYFIHSLGSAAQQGSAFDVAGVPNEGPTDGKHVSSKKSELAKSVPAKFRKRKKYDEALTPQSLGLQNGKRRRGSGVGRASGKTRRKLQSEEETGVKGAIKESGKSADRDESKTMSAGDGDSGKEKTSRRKSESESKSSSRGAKKSKTADRVREMKRDMFFASFLLCDDFICILYISLCTFIEQQTRNGLPRGR